MVAKKQVDKPFEPSDRLFRAILENPVLLVVRQIPCHCDHVVWFSLKIRRGVIQAVKPSAFQILNLDNATQRILSKIATRKHSHCLIRSWATDASYENTDVPII